MEMAMVICFCIPWDFLEASFLLKERELSQRGAVWNTLSETESASSSQSQLFQLNQMAASNLRYFFGAHAIKYLTKITRN